MLLMAESQEKKFDRDEAITFPKLSFETTIPIAVVASILYSIGGAIMDGYNFSPRPGVRALMSPKREFVSSLKTNAAGVLVYAIAGSAGYNIVSSFRSTEDALPIIAAGSAMGGYSGFKSGSVSGGISGAIGGMIVTTMATQFYLLAQKQHKHMDDLDERFAYFTPEHSRVPTSKRQVPPSAIKYDYGKIVSEKYNSESESQSE